MIENFKRVETNEEKVDRLLSENFDKHYNSVEEFEEDLLNNIKIALRDVKEGNLITVEELLKEMEEEYHID